MDVSLTRNGTLATASAPGGGSGFAASTGWAAPVVDAREWSRSSRSLPPRYQLLAKLGAAQRQPGTFSGFLHTRPVWGGEQHKGGGVLGGALAGVWRRSDDPSWRPPVGCSSGHRSAHGLGPLGGQAVVLQTVTASATAAGILAPVTAVMLPSAMLPSVFAGVGQFAAGLGVTGCAAFSSFGAVPWGCPLGSPRLLAAGTRARATRRAAWVPVRAVPARGLNGDAVMSQGRLFATPALKGATSPREGGKQEGGDRVHGELVREQANHDEAIDERANRDKTMGAQPGRTQPGEPVLEKKKKKKKEKAVAVLTGQDGAEVGQKSAKVGQDGVEAALASKAVVKAGKDGVKMGSEVVTKVVQDGVEAAVTDAHQDVNESKAKASDAKAKATATETKAKKKVAGKVHAKEPSSPAGMLASLDEQQLAAVTCRVGPVRVVAGPGSGKTRVLTHRVMHLMTERKVPPYRILCITFTNKARGEMLERLEHLVGPDVNALMIGTFHSVCCRFLRKFIEEIQDSGRSNRFTILDDDDSLAIFKDIVNESEFVSEKVIKDRLRKLAKGHADIKSEMYATGRSLAAVWDRPLSPLTIAAKQAVEMVAAGRVGLMLLEGYERQLVEDDAYDFTDLVGVVRREFARNNELLKRFQSKFDHVLVDEFQDTDQMQYDVIQMLAASHRSLFVVGDVDQAIYGFRGSDTANLTNKFDSDFPGTETYQLSKNYRSSARIVSAANAVIKSSELNRAVGGRMLIPEPTQPAGSFLYVHEGAESSREEAWHMAEEISYLLSRNVRADEVAILYRTNRQSAFIQNALTLAGVPFCVCNGSTFLDKRDVRDLLAYARLVANPRSNGALRRIINVPKRGVGDKTFETLQAWAEKNGTTVAELVAAPMPDHTELGISKKAWTTLRAFGEMMHELRDAAQELPLPALFRRIYDRTGFGHYTLEQLKGTEREVAKQRIKKEQELEQLLQMAAKFQSMGGGLEDFLEELTLDQQLLEEEGGPREGEDIARVQLMTMHYAKGLEFDVVFVAGVEEALVPHARAIDSYSSEQIGEERNLFYVALTRARKRLYITHAKDRSDLYPDWFAKKMTHGFESVAIQESRFLKPLKMTLKKGELSGYWRTWE